MVLSSKQIVDGRLFGPLNMWYFGVNCDIVFKCVAMNHLNEEVKGVKGGWLWRIFPAWPASQDDMTESRPSLCVLMFLLLVVTSSASTGWGTCLGHHQLSHRSQYRL